VSFETEKPAGTPESVTSELLSSFQVATNETELDGTFKPPRERGCANTSIANIIITLELSCFIGLIWLIAKFTVSG
jgi:hypothetical protein